MTLADRLIARVTRRAPDFVIGGAERPYLRRWWLLPRNRFFNVYLHQFLRSDDDRALHTHPWAFNASLLLRGEYVEHTKRADGSDVRTHRRAGDWKVRLGAAPHRIELLTTAEYVTTQPHSTTLLPCWTLFITGPRVREWHFLCPQGLVHWRDFTSPADKGSIGKGCEQ